MVWCGVERDWPPGPPFSGKGKVISALFVVLYSTNLSKTFLLKLLTVIGATENCRPRYLRPWNEARQRAQEQRACRQNCM